MSFCILPVSKNSNSAFNFKTLDNLTKQFITNVKESLSEHFELDGINVDNIIYESLEKVTPKENGKKESKKREKKDPNAPKKPATGFMLFSMQNREKVKKDHPELDPKQIQSHLGGLWKELSQEEKDKFSPEKEKVPVPFMTLKEIRKNTLAQLKDHVLKNIKEFDREWTEEELSKFTKKQFEDILIYKP